MQDEASNERPSTNGLTRRDVLKRGLVFTGALAWSTPAIQSIGMSRALAQETSGPCKTYCIKFEFDGGDDTNLNGDWFPLGADNPGNCFACPADSENALPPEIGEFEVVSGDRTDFVTIKIPASCEFPETDSTPDELVPEDAVVASKCGSDECNFQDQGDLNVRIAADGSTLIDVKACGSQRAISHIELLVRCC